MKIIWTLFALGLALRVWLLYCGLRLRQFVKGQLRQPPPTSALPVTLIAPCKGIDPGFEQNVQAVLAQQYPNFWEVIFVVESTDDPAYPVLEKLIEQNKRIEHPEQNPTARASIQIAGLTESCSQKIHNMLAAIDTANPQSRAFAFIDSDVRPGPHWLAHLIEPLSQDKFPASTGYRWYVPNLGGFASATRAVWNSLVSAVGDPRWRAYAWGGSFAIRRDAYEKMHLRKLWSNALSEDMILSKQVHKAHKKVAFVSHCVIPSHEDCSWSQGFDFICRQSLVSRIYGPELYFAGWILCLAYLVPLLTLVGTAVWLLLNNRPGGFLLLVATILLYVLELAVGIQRRKTVGRILPKCDFSKTRWMDTFGQAWVVAVTLLALICSGLSRKMFWRGRLYTLISPQKTLVEQDADVMC